MPNAINSNSIVKFSGVSKIFEPRETAVKNVDLEVFPGEFLCIIGPSGEGKSTILQLIAGIEEPSAGKITKPRNVAMVFQSGALLPWLTAFDNAALGLRARNLPEAQVRAETGKYLEMTGLGGLEAKYPRELSGGQRQRVGIARALTVEPAVMLLDEPFSALDPKTTEELHKDIIKIWEDTKKTIVMVSHSIEEAVTLADRILLIKNHTVENTFEINLLRPRRENEEVFAREVNKIRKEFFR